MSLSEMDCLLYVGAPSFGAFWFLFLICFSYNIYATLINWFGGLSVCRFVKEMFIFNRRTLFWSVFGIYGYGINNLLYSKQTQNHIYNFIFQHAHFESLPQGFPKSDIQSWQ